MTTVSHVINGTRPASEATRRSVLAAIERTGYRPNTFARALARGGTQSLGLAISGLSNPYFMDVVAASRQPRAAPATRCCSGDTREDPEHELRIVRTLAERQVDGLLLAPSVGALEHTLPVPRVRQASRSCCSTASCDVAARSGRLRQRAAHRAARRAPDRPRPPADRDGDRHPRALAPPTSACAATGWRSSGRASPFDPALVAEGGSQRDQAREAMHALLDLPEPPTAVVSGNNFMTIGLLRAIAERGLKRPRRHRARRPSTTSSGPTCSHPRLTVIRQPTTELGSRAVELLLSRLEDPSRPLRTERLEATFVHRDSCGCTEPSRAAQRSRATLKA